MSELITAIRQAVRSMIKPDLLLGEVISFNADDWTIDVKLNMGASVEDVTIKSVLNGDASGILVEPEIGSKVLCGLTDGKIENLTVLVFSEIKNIHLVPSEKIVLRSEDFGGVVKSSVVHSEIGKVRDELNTLKQILSAWVPVPSDGGAVLKAALSGFYAPIVAPSQTDFENENVQHG